MVNLWFATKINNAFLGPVPELVRPVNVNVNVCVPVPEKSRKELSMAVEVCSVGRQHG